MRNNNYICHAPYFRNSTSSYHNFLYTYVKQWYLQSFFYFFKILIFWVVRELKGQKIIQNDKKFCPLRSVSEEPYIIWLSFMFVKSSCIFFFFWKLIFLVQRGVKGQKNGPGWQKIMSLTLHISRAIHHMIVICGENV